MKHFLLPPHVPLKKLNDLFWQSVKQSADAVIVSPKESDLKNAHTLSRRMKFIFEKAVQHHIDVEIGGWELSSLVPRKHFFFHKDLFRMVQGERIKNIHFCPTNPDTINLVQKEARKLFSRFPEVSVFHLWPDRYNELMWCNCPSCRAFSFAEQNIIAVNAAADILAEINPGAMLSYIEIETINDEKPSINPRANMFAVSFVSSVPENDGVLLETIE